MFDGNYMRSEIAAFGFIYKLKWRFSCFKFFFKFIYDSFSFLSDCSLFFRFLAFFFLRRFSLTLSVRVFSCGSCGGALLNAFNAVFNASPSKIPFL